MTLREQMERERDAFERRLAYLKEQLIAAAEVEESGANERPRCETPLATGPNGLCGSEEGLRRIIYTPIPYVAPEPKDTIHCPKHFGDAWKSDNAERAEPVKTAKD